MARTLQEYLAWAAGPRAHGSLAGMVVNPAAVRSQNMPWGENLHFDAAGNVVSMYMPAPAGVKSPYGDAGGPSAPGPPSLAAALAGNRDVLPQATPTPPMTMAALDTNILAALAQAEAERKRREEEERLRGGFGAVAS